MIVYGVWLLCIIIWNYAFPNVSPLADVIAAIILSTLSIVLNKFKNETNR